MESVGGCGSGFGCGCVFVGLGLGLSLELSLDLGLGLCLGLQAPVSVGILNGILLGINSPEILVFLVRLQHVRLVKFIGAGAMYDEANKANVLFCVVEVPSCSHPQPHPYPRVQPHIHPHGHPHNITSTLVGTLTHSTLFQSTCPAGR